MARRRGRFYADPAGIQELLIADFLGRAMLARANEIKALAIEIAPKRTGNYSKSFYTDVRIGGSHRSKRIAGVVGNDDRGAYQIEVGTKDTPAHRTLRTAAGTKRKRGGTSPEADA